MYLIEGVLCLCIVIMTSSVTLVLCFLGNIVNKCINYLMY